MDAHSRRTGFRRAGFGRVRGALPRGLEVRRGTGAVFRRHDAEARVPESQWRKPVVHRNRRPGSLERIDRGDSALPRVARIPSPIRGNLRPAPRRRRIALTNASLHRPLLAWYRANRRDLPWRRTADPYAIWISEAMLQQTRVETVLGYWPKFLERFPDIKSLARAREADVLAAWSGLGYYRRAKSLREAARAIVERHDGEFPRERDSVLGLPGIGPYTAGAVLSIAFDQREP